jgi:hypothetical protein
MTDIFNTYPVFERNQVLTSSQLNNMVNYLDQQNRLTRAKLIGMGVVCGLEIEYDKSENTIAISKGTGITSEGYLINIGDCVTVKYRPYNLPPTTIYEPFVDANNKQDIKLFELLTENVKAGADDKLLDDESFLSDKIVLLFIESFDKDLKSCLGKNCDELGKERILTLRKLLIGKIDLQKVLDRTNTGKLDAVFPEKFELPVVNMRRVLFNPNEPNSKVYKDFSVNYTTAVLEVFEKLMKALAETYDIYRPLLLESYNELNPFTTDPVLTKLGELQNFLNDAIPAINSYFGVQYVYDLFQDLILGYNEFKDTAFDLMSECSADMTRFPKHLMLGEAMPLPTTLCESSDYRHYFVQPPIYNLQKLLIQRTIALHNRLVLMLESFDLKRINMVKTEEIKAFPIRITPSHEKTTQLSLRSIPWYYDLKKKSSYAALGTLKRYWNFDISRKCTDEKGGLVLNYEDQLLDQSVAKYKLGTPLFFDIQDYPFLRIEGQSGINVKLVEKRLKSLKAQFDLPFDLIALQLDPNLGSISIDYKCGFEDLQEEYNILKLNFCRFAADLRELYKFVDENQETLFDNDNENSEDIKKYLETLKSIIASIDDVCGSLGDCINNFDFPGFQEKYKTMLGGIIDFILIDLELLQKINLGEDDAKEQIPLINGIIQRLSPLANKLIDLFFYNRFLRLHYSFKRREFYLKKQIDTFSTYIAKNPGIEHQAGVPKGGTFILVYVNDANSNVFADFALPYLCCTKSNCIPACDDQGGFVFEVKPFARPDYAITLVDVPVEIDVFRNDMQVFDAELSIKDDESWKKDRTVEMISEPGLLKYTPAEGFVGTDTFTYLLVDNKTGNSDVGKVTVVVKTPEQKGCYTVDILRCWGDESVMRTLEIRKIQVPQGANIHELLLESLRKTGGFTIHEIRFNVLEGEESRRRLLNCIGIEIGPNTTYEDMEQLILDYQKQNCGAVQTGCYSVENLICWGEEAVIDTLEHRDLGIAEGSDMFETLLADLRKTGGFTEDEIFSSVLEEPERRRGLLNCLGIPNNENTKYEELGRLILDYQKQNCGTVQPVGTCYSLEILRCWGDDGVKDTFERRGLTTPEGGNMFEAVLADLRRTRGFTDTEIRTNVLESPDRRRNLLKCLGIPVSEATPYEQLGQLIVDYQLQNCGAAVARPGAVIELGLLAPNEMAKVLEARGRRLSSTGSREDLEKAIETSGGNVLTETELMAVSRDSLTNILASKNIAHTTSENKTQLIKKLLGRN